MNPGIPVSGILTRVNECRDRQWIQVSQWMENIVNHHQEIVSDKGNNRDRSVCLKSITPINLFSICPGKSTPQSRQWNISNSLGSQVCVRFFHFCTHRKGSSKCKSGSVSNVHNSPSMARPTLVPSVSENVWKKNHELYHRSKIYRKILQKTWIHY